ncbi:Star-Related Lipid Transfer Protein 9 [Manis pentadactyla]|nr:Star-Related Lipid Transfer Protein 9 [Manis pentadactyla]
MALVFLRTSSSPATLSFFHSPKGCRPLGSWPNSETLCPPWPHRLRAGGELPSLRCCESSRPTSSLTWGASPAPPQQNQVAENPSLPWALLLP